MCKQEQSAGCDVLLLSVVVHGRSSEVECALLDLIDTFCSFCLVFFAFFLANLKVQYINLLLAVEVFCQDLSRFMQPPNR